jgi:hypothetical protein
MSARSVRSALLALLLLLVGVAGAGAASPTALFTVYLPLVGYPGVEVSLSPIGSPIWKPGDIHLFAAPIGSAPDYSGFSDTIALLLPAPNHVGGQTGAAHPPPYDVELAEGVTRQGYEQRRQYTRAQFSAGSGVYLVWMMLPAPGVTGSSSDTISGPVIPKTVFPIHVSCVALRNGAAYDPTLYVDDIFFDDPALDGVSHFPIFTADNSDFGPAGTPVEGNYEYRVTMTDQQGQGWSMVARFQVLP